MAFLLSVELRRHSVEPWAYSSISSVSFPPYDSHLSICHLNIQSILPKIDILLYEMQPFDILVFTESWLNADISDTDISVVNFKIPFRMIVMPNLEG